MKYTQSLINSLKRRTLVLSKISRAPKHRLTDLPPEIFMIVTDYVITNNTKQGTDIQNLRITCHHFRAIFDDAFRMILAHRNVYFDFKNLERFGAFMNSVFSRALKRIIFNFRASKPEFRAHLELLKTPLTQLHGRELDIFVNHNSAPWPLDSNNILADEYYSAFFAFASRVKLRRYGFKFSPGAVKSEDFLSRSEQFIGPCQDIRLCIDQSSATPTNATHFRNSLYSTASVLRRLENLRHLELDMGLYHDERKWDTWRPRCHSLDTNKSFMEHLLRKVQPRQLHSLRLKGSALSAALLHQLVRGQPGTSRLTKLALEDFCLLGGVWEEILEDLSLYSLHELELRSLRDEKGDFIAPATNATGEHLDVEARSQMAVTSVLACLRRTTSECTFALEFLGWTLASQTAGGMARLVQGEHEVRLSL